MEEKGREKIIIGIDPGTTIMGYGCIKCTGKEFELVHYGVVHLSKLSNQMLKLQRIFEKSLHLIDSYQPDEIAIESTFYGKNIQSMLKLGRAQGVTMAAALYREIPIFEYAPRKIKQSITGKGAASKEQVAGMLMNLLSIKDKHDHLDATDGLAVAVCHFFQQNNPQKSKSGGNDWGQFIKNNPGRIG